MKVSRVLSTCVATKMSSRKKRSTGGSLEEWGLGVEDPLLRELLGNVC